MQTNIVLVVISGLDQIEKANINIIILNKYYKYNFLNLRVQNVRFYMLIDFFCFTYNIFVPNPFTLI